MREVLTIVSAGVLGLLFGLGLIASHMTDPAVIVAFLDVAGDWNPSLALVMVSAVIVAFPAFVLARRSHHALLGEPFSLPERLRIDRRLVSGAAVFGIGWGLAGICPGPGLVLLGSLDNGAMIFVPAVILGAYLARLRPPALVTST